MEGGPLMNQFSRLYRISATKHSSVKDFIEAAGLNFSRVVLWCRPIINRDKEQILILEQRLQIVSLTEGFDSLVWTPGKGILTSKFLSNLYDSHSRLPGTSSGN